MEQTPTIGESEGHGTTREAANPTIHLPSPTPWPFVLAFGLTMVAAGLVTILPVTLFGVGLSIVAGVGWFREVLPVQKHDLVTVREEKIEITTSRREVERIAVAPDVSHARLPFEIYPVRAGIVGGLVGGVAMAIVAMIYGVVSHHSIWYPANLVGAIIYLHSLSLTTSFLDRFNPLLLGIALLIHISVCLLVGVLYGTMLPMLPRRPILLGGIIAPLVWSGLMHGFLNIVNPLLYQRVNWPWFVASQIAFGLVAGEIVVRHQRVRVRQTTPLLYRAGIEATGMPPERKPGENGKS